MLRDVSQRSMATTVLGHELSMPIAISPTAMQRMAHPEGECASVAGMILAEALTSANYRVDNNYNLGSSQFLLFKKSIL